MRKKNIPSQTIPMVEVEDDRFSEGARRIEGLWLTVGKQKSVYSFQIGNAEGQLISAVLFLVVC